MTNPDAVQRCFLAEWYQAAVVRRNVDEVATVLGDAAARLRGQGLAIRLLATLQSRHDQVLYGLFTATSAAAVVRVGELAGWPADRVSGDVLACISI